MGINYAAASAAGTSSVGLVIRLYETIIADLGRAITAVRDNDIERRTFELQHALAVIGQLQGCLDLTNGGAPAQELEKFYDVNRARILNAQLRHSGKILEEVMRDFLTIREAWVEVEKHNVGGAVANQPLPEETHGDWVA